MNNNKQDCYSKGERAFMQWGQKLRAGLLGPVLKVLALCGIRADWISYLSLIFGLLAACLFARTMVPALVLLLIHVLLDGLDGPLARYKGTASPKGSFTDTVCDQIVVTAVCIALIDAGLISTMTA